jgi:hypothetical protein
MFDSKLELLVNASAAVSVGYKRASLDYQCSSLKITLKVTTTTEKNKIS